MVKQCMAWVYKQFISIIIKAHGFRIREKKNQRKFREILAKYGISQAQAAALITKETNQKVSTRKVRSWLANPEVLSARSCPNWAVTAFKKVIMNPLFTEQKKSE